MKKISTVVGLAIPLAFGPASAQAQPLINEMTIGVLAQGWGGPGADKAQGVAINAEVAFASPKWLAPFAKPNPIAGISIAPYANAVSYLYGGLEWRASISPRFYFKGSVAGAVHDGETDFDPLTDLARVNEEVFLGCRGLFRLGAGVGYQVSDRVSASIDVAHLSNAGVCAPNEGLDQMGVRFGYAF